MLYLKVNENINQMYENNIIPLLAYWNEPDDVINLVISHK